MATENKEIAKSDIALAKEKAEEVYKQTEEELKKVQEEITAELQKVIDSLQKEITAKFNDYRMYDLIWCMALKYSVFKGEGVGLNDLDVIMLTKLAIKMCGAVTTGLLHILKKAMNKMLNETNPLRLILLTVPNFTILCASACGFQVACIIMTINIIQKIIKDYTLKKMKCKVLVSNIINGKTPTLYTLDKSEELMKKQSQSLSGMVNTYMDAVLISEKSKVSELPDLPSGELDIKAEKEFRNKINDYNKQTNDFKKNVDVKFNTIRTKSMNIKSNYEAIFKDINTKLFNHTVKYTPKTIMTYYTLSKGLADSHDKYAKLIASLFTKAKAEGNPVIELINSLNDPDFDDLKALFTVTSEDAAKIGGQAAVQAVEEAKKQKENIEQNQEVVPASTSSSSSEPSPGTSEKSVEEAIKELTENSKSLSREIAEKTAAMSNTIKDFSNKMDTLIQDQLNSVYKYIEAEVETLTIEKVYDVFKVVNGEAFVEALCSMISLEDYYQRILTKIYLSYKSIGDLFDAYYKETVFIYQEILEMSTGTAIMKQLFKDIGDEKSGDLLLAEYEKNKALIENTLETAQDIAEISKDLAGEVMQFVSELPAKVAELLSQITMKITESIMKLLEKLAMLLVGIFVPDSVKSEELPDSKALKTLTKAVKKEM